MTSSNRLNRIHALVKIQEQMILSEFKDLQDECEKIRVQIDSIEKYSLEAREYILTRSISKQELVVAKQFRNKLDQISQVLQTNLELAEQNYSIVAQKIKETRRTILSIGKLIEREKARVSNTLQLAEQRQIEEYLGYLKG